LAEISHASTPHRETIAAGLVTLGHVDSGALGRVILVGLLTIARSTYMITALEKGN
jgi:hypothetical protein